MRLNKLKEQGLATEEDLLVLETAKENIVSYNEGLDEKG